MKIDPKRFLLAVLAGVVLSAPTRADMAEPDVAFGNGGTASMPLPCPPNTCYQYLDHGNPLAVRPDGRFLLVGTSNLWGAGTPGDFVILQRLANGAPDPSFGQDGVVRPHANDYWHRGSAIALRPDGRIVAAGLVSKTADPGQGHNLVIFARNADGSPDASFPNGGNMQLGGIGSVLAVHGLVVQPGGRSIVAYSVGEGSAINTLLVAFNAQGRVDASFGNQGFVALSTAYGNVALAQNSQGLIAAAVAELGDTRVFVMSADGTTLPGFPALTPALMVRAVALDAQGRVLLGGSFGPRPRLRRLTALGAIDTSFASSGTWASEGGAQVASLAVLGDGRIVGTGGVGQAYVWRWLGNGAPDPDFRGSGMVLAGGFQSGAGYGMQVAPHPSGGLIVAINTGPGVLFTGTPQYDTIRAAKLGGFTYPIAEPAPYVAQLYRDFLGREADYNGLAHWSGRIEAGEPGGAVAEAFMGSPEFHGVVPPVARLLFSWTNRVPTWLELERAVRRVRSGESLTSLARSFAFLPDAQALYGGLTDEQFVDRMYALVLGRAADSGGRAHWLARLSEGMQRGDLMLNVSESPEHRTLVAAEVFVTSAYAGLLRRTPEPGGFAFWVNAMEGGMGGRAVIDAILGSAEYQRRFVP